MENPVSCFASVCILIFFLCSACGEQRGKYDLQSAEADLLIQEAIEDSLFAGAVLLTAHNGEMIHHRAYGHAAIYKRDGSKMEEPDVMTTEHLFDLASLTKIFATTYTLMHLQSEGHMSVDDNVAVYLPEFNTEEKKDITIRHLLGHKSGMAQWHPTYYEANNSNERLKYIAGKSLTWNINEERRYSDLGFMVLADVIENVSGTEINEYLLENIYEPLDLQRTLFNPDKDVYPKIVSTSHGNPFEKKMVYEDDFGFSVDVDPESWDSWREYVLQGEVNDGNSHYTHGGVAGHAGLFSTAEELYRLLQLVMNYGPADENQYFSNETVELFLTPDQFGHGLGWMMTSASLHGRNLSVGSFGHTGFTGTNVLVVPDEELVIIFLTNRQHFGVDETGNYPDLRGIREELADIFLSSEPEIL